MEINSKTAEKQQDGIFQKLKERAKHLGFARLKCEIVIHDGYVKEIDILKDSVEKIRG